MNGAQVNSVFQWQTPLQGKKTKQCWVLRPTHGWLDEEIIPRIDCVYIPHQAADSNPGEWNENID